MRVLLVLEDKSEAKALGEIATELGMTCRLGGTLIEAEALLKQQPPWSAIVVRRGKGAIALRSFLRAAASNAPTAKIFVLGSAPPSSGDESQLREIAAASSVELLGEAPALDVVVRLAGVRIGKPPAVIAFETLTRLDDRKTWTQTLARDRETSERGVLSMLDPRIALDKDALAGLSAALAPVIAVKHPTLSAAKKVLLDAPSPIVFWPSPPGILLSELLARTRASPDTKLLPIGGVLGVMAQLGGALRALHAAGVAHGAVEPWSVWASDDGSVRLLNQGFAAFAEAERRRARGKRFQLPVPDDSLPPELAIDEQGVGPASDVYGAGIVLYELLCGVRPFRRRTASETLQAILREEPAPPLALRPDVPAHLSALTISMLAKKPAERPAHGGVLEEAFLAMLPKADGWRRLLGSIAKPETLVASMLRDNPPPPKDPDSTKT